MSRATTITFESDYDVEGMTFDDFCTYQDFVASIDKAGTDLNPLLGLFGEVGEIAEKLKKWTRGVNDEFPYGTDTLSLRALSDEQRKELAKELGDVLWYLANFSDKLGFRFGEIVRLNVEKLASRKTRGILHGKGDNR